MLKGKGRRHRGRNGYIMRMRVHWKRVLLFAAVAGLLALLLRGLLLARCAPGAALPTEKDAVITVYDHREEAYQKLPLETYILRVAAAEMP